MKNESVETQNPREEQYQSKQKALLKKCIECNSQGLKPSYERCDYACSTGKMLRRLETEYSDITGWSHDTWHNPETTKN